MDIQRVVIGVLFIALVILLVWSIARGRNAPNVLAVFGNPARTHGSGHWVVCGVSSLLLIWLVFSWDAARAFFPRAANELCQVAKVDRAMHPLSSALGVTGERYKSTVLLQRSVRQLADLEARLGSFGSDAEGYALLAHRVRTLLLHQASPMSVSADTARRIEAIQIALDNAALALVSDDYRVDVNLAERDRAAAQPAWGAGPVEIPTVAETEKGMRFNAVSRVLDQAGRDFSALNNSSPALVSEAALLQADIGAAGVASSSEESRIWLKALDKTLMRVDDFKVFPTSALAPLEGSVRRVQEALADASGGLKWIDTLALPGGRIVAGNRACSEQGSGRWLPKPTDTVAAFLRMADPGHGYKGLPLLWFEWRPVAELIGAVLPDSLVTLVPGGYPRHAANGAIGSNAKSRVHAVLTGQFDSFKVPWPIGHIWDSLLRVLAGLILGIVLGVPLGLYMGLSRFAKGFFDPLIELYRPVPPLAWAPLVLTVFGIHDDGKVFLLFIVAFAIMVISARTGATGTQLSKVHAAHSLGASNAQILRRVILPNALPDILTGVRIAVGVCWGTLVAAEMLAGTTGLGFVENVARKQSDYEVIWVTIILLGVLGLLLDLLMRAVIRRATPWRGQG